jgi:alpha/beta superfamily hydrolase
MPDITFTGPAGRIEAKYFQGKEPSAPIALVLHPHPQKGGTMNSKVAFRLYESFARCGFNTLRFNFRGVGNSEGKYDEGIGELSDAAAALDWLHARHPHARNIWVSGFSFGAWIAMQLLMRRPDVSRFVAVSPPIGVEGYDFSFFSPCPSSGLVVMGTNDELIRIENVEKVLHKTQRQKDVKLHYSKVDGADHFYSRQQDELANILTNYIKLGSK